MTNTLTRWLRLYSVLLCAVIAMPIIATLVTSFTADNFIRLPPAHWGFRWYGIALGDDTFRPALLFSLETALAAAAASTVLGVACAYGLARYQFPGRNAIESIVMAPLFIPHIMIAIGIVKLMSDLKIPTSPVGLVIGQTLVVLPFVVRLAMVGLESVDRRVEYAARSLGAGPWQQWFRITLPIALPSIVAGTTMAFLIAFDEAVISVFTAAPGQTTLPVAILNYVEQQTDPRVSAVSSIMIVLAAVCVFILERTVGLVRILAGESAASALDEGQ